MLFCAINFNSRMFLRGVLSDSFIIRLNGDTIMIKLQYIGKMKWAEALNIDSRMWNVIQPRLTGYSYDLPNCYPTFTLTGLKEKGLLK